MNNIISIASRRIPSSYSYHYHPSSFSSSLSFRCTQILPCCFHNGKERRRTINTSTTTSTTKTTRTSRPRHLQQYQYHHLHHGKQTQLKFFSSEPLGEIRAQVRDEHIKEEILSQKKALDKQINENDQDNNKTPKRLRLSDVPISEVLKAKHTLRWVEPIIDRNSTVRDAIKVCIERGLSAMMVVDRDTSSSTSNDDGNKNFHGSVSNQRGRVVGMATSRDLIRIIHSGLRAKDLDGDGIVDSEAEIFNLKVGDYMTPITQVIYARPEETIGTCRSIMAKLGVKCLPILSHGRVEGLVTSRDMSDYGLDATERGGKKHFLENRSERTGLSSSNTSMAEPPAYIKAHLKMQKSPLYMNLGVAELPHPYKTPESCGMNRRG